MNIDTVQRLAQSIKSAMPNPRAKHFQQTSDSVRNPTRLPKEHVLHSIPRTKIVILDDDTEQTVHIEAFEFDDLEERRFYVRVLAITEEEADAAEGRDDEDEDDTDEDDSDELPKSNVGVYDLLATTLPAYFAKGTKTFTDLKAAYEHVIDLLTPRACAGQPALANMPHAGSPVVADRIALNSISLDAGEVTQSLHWLSVHAGTEELIVALAAVGDKLFVHDESHFLTAIGSKLTVAEFLSNTARSTWMKKITECLNGLLQAYGSCSVVQSGVITELNKTITHLLFEIQLDSGHTFWFMAEAPE